MKYAYPAIFTKDGDFITVRFPDLKNCFTEGSDIEDAIEAAGDVLCLTLYNLEEQGAAIPAPSDVRSISTDPDSFVSLVFCDTIEYRQFYDNRAVKKTLTIPSWLNTMSERAGVNFSAVLQKALKQELKLG